MLNRDTVAFPSLAHPPLRGWKRYQQRLLTALQQEEMRHLPVTELCRQAGVSPSAWYRAVKKPLFVEAIEALGVPIQRQQERHLDVTLALHPEEEFAKDIWDMRRLKADYPKHRAPYDFKVDFTWIVN